MEVNKIRLIIETNLGKIRIRLYNNTPLNSGNMLRLALLNYYNGTMFHRCIPNFMIQGGDPESKNATPGQALGRGGLEYTVPAEINKQNFHRRGALGVARGQTPDKSGSACQFYIVTGRVFTNTELSHISRMTGINFTDEQLDVYTTIGGAPHLDGNYTVFGEVEEELEIIDKISHVARDNNDRPLEDVIIKSIYLPMD